MWYPSTRLQTGKQQVFCLPSLRHFSNRRTHSRSHSWSLAQRFPFQPHSRLSQPFGAYRLSYPEPRGCGRDVPPHGFNYIMDNKDDHCKNFSFLVQKESDGKWHWHLAPAYDLTHCAEGYNGEHATSVNGTGHPTVEDMIAVGVKNKMKEKRCREIYEEVTEQC